MRQPQHAAPRGRERLGGFAATTLALQGCFALDIPPGALRCAPERTSACPAGMICLMAGSEGRCYPPGQRPDSRAPYLDQGGPSTDASFRDAGGPDAEPDVERPLACPWSGNFTFDPVPLVALNTDATEGEPHVTRDGLTLYFSSDRPGGAGGDDGYVARRASRADAFGDVQPNPLMRTPANDTRFALSRDELTAFIASERPGGSGGSDIWSVSRARLDEPFSAANLAPLSAVNTALDDWDPFAASHGDALQLFFMRADPAHNTTVIMMAERPRPRASFGSPLPVAGLYTLDDAQENPSLTRDGLVIVYSSKRDPLPTAKRLPDLWYAVRPSRQDAFSQPQRVPGVNSDYREGEVFVEEEGCELYFGSNRPTGYGLDLYHARYRRLP